MKQNSSDKLPYLPFYVKDHQDDTGIKLLDFHDQGVWLSMLFTMHTCEPRGKLMVNGAALTDEQIFRMLGLDNQTGTTTLTTLLKLGVARRCPETGAIMSKRMVEDEKLRKIRQEAGKKGGNPRLLKQKPTNLVNQMDNQQDNQFREYEYENENENDSEDGNGSDSLTALLSTKSDAFKSAWQEWMTYRNTLQPILAPGQFARQLQNVAAWPESEVIEAIGQSIGNGWKSLVKAKQTPKAQATVSLPDLTLPRSKPTVLPDL